jgi:glycine dehydrogenase subunit 1
VAAVVVQTPSFFGCIEDVEALAALAHDKGALLIAVNTDPSAFALLEPPGKLGADIVIAEGQALGVAPSYGGPHVGLFGARSKFVRQMPGRLCGQTVDVNGQSGFVLTLSTREQHIRREKATSNICTNQGLVALQVCIYLSLMGPRGLARVARTGAAHAHHFLKEIEGLAGFEPLFPGAHVYHEVALRTPMDARVLVARLADEGIAAGVPLGRFFPEMSQALLVNFTEVHSRADVDTLVRALARLS